MTIRPKDEIFLTTKQVCERFACVSMTLWRWQRDPKVRFPYPVRVNGGKNLFRLSDLMAFEERKAQPVNGAPAKLSPKIPEDGWRTK